VRPAVSMAAGFLFLKKGNICLDYEMRIKYAIAVKIILKMEEVESATAF